MPRASRVFRIFVSSTFADLKAERNALQREVYPKLQALCAGHGARFQAIDLRWGVSDEAGLDQQTMKICLAEIARCQATTRRPNFMILLGDRYGWRPAPAEIPAAEFAQIHEQIAAAAGGGDRSAADDLALLDQWYVRDDNAVPPAYMLQPRDPAGPLADYEVWYPVEQRLRGALRRVLDQIELSAEARLRYIASATEQEIAAGVFAAPDAGERVCCFTRHVDGLPADAGEFRDLEDGGRLDEEAAALLSDLKTRLRKVLGDNVVEYRAQWTGQGIGETHLAQLCADVEERLSTLILQEIARLDAEEAADEELAVCAFADEKARHFTGRAAELTRIAEYIDAGGDRPLVVCGASGSGKSSLMARALQLTAEADPDAVVLGRFIGATAGSSDVRNLLESLSRATARRYGAQEPAAHGFDELVQDLPAKLGLAAAEGRPRLVIFLDALDQLADTNHALSLTWLPDCLPDNVRLIVSTMPGPCMEVLRHRLAAGDFVELRHMPPAEAGELLDRWLAGAARTLQPRQREQVLAGFAGCPYPLYLELVFGEARLWRSTEVGTPPASDVRGVIRSLFERLARDANHGKMLVSRSLGYLAAARYGLSEEEILGVLARDPTFFDHFKAHAHFELETDETGPADGIPVVVWSRLYYDLEPYLTERDEEGARVLAFYHRQLREVAAQEYLLEPAEAADDADGVASAAELSAAGLERHRMLAHYFRERADPAGDGSWTASRCAVSANCRIISPRAICGTI